MSAKVGVLALQGDVREHLDLLRSIDVAGVPVRSTDELETVDALVMPGGESTTIGFLLDEHEMIEPLRKRITDGMPVLGTCAGAILLSTEVVGGDVPKIGVLDARIHRNAYGRQVDSFEENLEVEGVGQMHAVFIRAPVFESLGPKVEVLARHGDRDVVVHQENVLAATFHPELSGDPGLHRLVVQMTGRG